MKRIAIISKKYGSGGVEKVLVDLVKNIDCTKYDIDLYLPEITEGIYPNDIRLIKMKNLTDGVSFCYLLNHPVQMACAAKALVKNKFSKKRNYIRQLSDNKYCFLKNDTEYDLAIAYDGPLGFSVFYTLYNIRSKKKYFWIHGSVVGDNIPKNIIEKYYSRFDKLIFVSRSVMDEYAGEYPDHARKITYFYNYIDVDGIREKAKAPITYVKKDGNTILTTVARLSKEKGIDIAIKTSGILRDMGLDFRWMIVGGGNEYDRLQKMICDNHLQEYVMLLGEKENPYPYIEMCDIYVQPSRTEGFCTATNEAKALLKPVIATDVGGMREQFIHNTTGIIVEPEKCEEMAQAIVKLCTDRDLRNSIITNLGSVTLPGDNRTISAVLDDD